MKVYLIKLKYILPVYLAILLCLVIGLAAIRWIVAIKFQFIDVKDEVWEFWVPAALPWIPILIWLRPRFMILSFKKEADKRRSFFQVICWMALAGVLGVSQSYLTTATGKMIKVAEIGEIGKKEKVRYYQISAYKVEPSFGSSYTDFNTSGRYNERFNIDIYFVTPFLEDTTTVTQRQIPKYWYGTVFKNQISNRLSQKEKELAFKTFFSDCVAKMNHYQFHAADHFERKPGIKNNQYFLKAIEWRIRQTAGENFVVLQPIAEPYEKRDGNKLGWFFGIFGIGLSILLLLLIWPGYSLSAHRKQLKGIKHKNDELIAVLNYLVPKGEHFMTSVLLDLNILVLLIMIFSGISPLWPHATDLLQWGGNRRAETTGGEWWRLLTNIFVHGGIMHLVLNIYGLVLAAVFVEPKLGRVRYLILYLLSGICGSLASIWWYPNTISVGASGAIFGLYGAILGLLLLNAYPKTGRKPMLLLTSIFIVINLLWGLTGGIDNAAHIGGLLSGVLTGMVLYKTIEKKEDPDDVEPLAEIKEITNND